MPDDAYQQKGSLNEITQIAFLNNEVFIYSDCFETKYFAVTTFSLWTQTIHWIVLSVAVHNKTKKKWQTNIANAIILSWEAI